MKKRIGAIILAVCVLTLSMAFGVGAADLDSDSVNLDSVKVDSMNAEKADNVEDAEVAAQIVEEPSAAISWLGKGELTNVCSRAIGIEIMNTGDTPLDLSEYQLNISGALALTVSEGENWQSETLAPQEYIWIWYDAEILPEASGSGMIQARAVLKKQDSTSELASAVREFAVFTIDEGWNVMTYTYPETHYKYRLRLDLDEHTSAYPYFLVAGGGGNATEFMKDGDTYETAFLDPAAASFPCVDLAEGYVFKSVELVPADAGSIERMQSTSSNIFRVQLNKPATLKVTTAKKEEVEKTEEGIILDKSSQGETMYPDAKLIVNKGTDTSAEQQLVISKLGISASQLQAFDLSLKDALGKVVEFTGTVKVSIPIPAGWDASSVFVYYTDAKTGTMTDMKGVVSADKKYIIFETTHFSTYVLATTKPVPIQPTEEDTPTTPVPTQPTEEGTPTTPVPTQPTEEDTPAPAPTQTNTTTTTTAAAPKTGDIQPVGLWALLMLGSIAGIAGFIVNKKRIY